jgi:hypothetical protein
LRHEPSLGLPQPDSALLLEQILAVDLAAGQGVAVAAAAAVVAVVPEACYSQKPKPCFA